MAKTDASIYEVTPILLDHKVPAEVKRCGATEEQLSGTKALTPSPLHAHRCWSGRYSGTTDRPPSVRMVCTPLGRRLDEGILQNAKPAVKAGLLMGI